MTEQAYQNIDGTPVLDIGKIEIPGWTKRSAALSRASFCYRQLYTSRLATSSSLSRSRLSNSLADFLAASLSSTAKSLTREE